MFFMGAYSQENFKLPNHELMTLKNGLQIYLVQQDEVPLIHFRAVVPAGYKYDQMGKNGLSNIVANSISAGSKNYTKSEIEETLDYIGASLNTSSGMESSIISSNFVSKDLETVLPILKDLILNPIFEEEEVNKLVQRVSIGIEQSKESPRAVIGNYFNKNLFKNHPYGNSASGDKESLNSLEIKDLKQFHKKYFIPNGSAIAIVGDFEKKKIKKLLSKNFKDWKKGKTIEFETPKINPIESSKVLIVNKENARETTMLIGGLGVPRNAEDLISIQVVNTILGGRFTSWLNDELRVNSGLTYGARSGFSSYKNGGSFSISTFTANQNSERTIDLALKTYNKLFNNEIDEALLESSKNYVKGQFPPRYETNSSIARFFTDSFVYNISLNYINEFSQKVNDIDINSTNKIVKNYFPKENLLYVFVGKAELIKPFASKYGEVQVVNIND
jgi:predicted Zn-dependent peptidase